MQKDTLKSLLEVDNGCRCLSRGSGTSLGPIVPPSKRLLLFRDTVVVARDTKQLSTTPALDGKRTPVSKSGHPSSAREVSVGPRNFLLVSG